MRPGSSYPTTLAGWLAIPTQIKASFKLTEILPPHSTTQPWMLIKLNDKYSHSYLLFLWYSEEKCTHSPTPILLSAWVSFSSSSLLQRQQLFLAQFVGSAKEPLPLLNSVMVTVSSPFPGAVVVSRPDRPSSEPMHLCISAANQAGSGVRVPRLVHHLYCSVSSQTYSI